MSKWIAVLVLALMGCATSPAGRDLTLTLNAYEKYIRWNELEQAMGFIDPEARPSARDEAFELDRFDQVRVTGYEVKARDLSPDERSLMQVVELRIYNRHTLRERTVIDRQQWRFDDEGDRWVNISGLPDLARRR